MTLVLERKTMALEEDTGKALIKFEGSFQGTAKTRRI